MFVPPRLVEAFDGVERPAVFVEATFTRTVRIWWSLLWQTVVGTVVVGSIAFLLITEVLGVDEGTWTQVACFAMALMLAGVVTTGRVLEKHFRGFRVALVERHPHLL